MAIVTSTKKPLVPSPELEALRAIDFDWTMHLKSVWTDPPFDSNELHHELRQDFANSLDELALRRDGNSPFGWVVVGPAGSGKTHWLATCRRQALARGMGFVLVDMTGVRDFWETVLQGYLDSLQQYCDNEQPQQELLLLRFLGTVKLRYSVDRALADLKGNSEKYLPKNINKIIETIRPRDPRCVDKYRDVIRAVIATSSARMEIRQAGLSWLNANPVDEELRVLLGFANAQEEPRKIVEALSWMMSLAGPTVLAFDQLDPIVSQLSLASQADPSSPETMAAQSIIKGLANGLQAIFDSLRRTFTVVSGLESTWHALSENTLIPIKDRFRDPMYLNWVQQQSVAESILFPRIDAACKRTGFTPPHKSWPLSRQALAGVHGVSPRQLLKACDRHRRQCLANGKFNELASLASDGHEAPVIIHDEPRLAAAFERYRQQANVPYLLEQSMDDDRIGPLLLAACRCLLREVELPGDTDKGIDEFPGGKGTLPLHARIRLTHRDQGDTEEHFCLRALQRHNPIAFQHRLRAAMVASGIDDRLGFRHTVILRKGDMPGGVITAALLREYQEKGGKWHAPSDDEVRTLFAIQKMLEDNQTGLPDWIASAKPASRLPLMRLLAPKLCGSEKASAGMAAGKPENVASIQTPPANAEAAKRPLPVGGPPEEHIKDVPQTTPFQPIVPQPPAAQVPTPPVSLVPKSAAPPTVQQPFTPDLQLGVRANSPGGQPETMPLAFLEKHTVVLAGAGSGKTMLLKRMIESCALAGIPSIVIDLQNDMAALGDARPEPAANWLSDDAQRASAFHRDVDVDVWTPGAQSGNPLVFQPLPDLSAFVDEPEEMNMAIELIAESLGPAIAQGKSATANTKRGLLQQVLRAYAPRGLNGLPGLIELLSELPPEASLGVAKEEKMAREMADALRVAQASNPLLRGAGTGLDPAVLFGDDERPRRTRVSVVNLHWLASLEGKQHFVNQLGMTLFGWIKQNPIPPDRPLRGLLVIDEAKDFVPSQGSTPCKEILKRLAAQARKFHLGVVFATQNPREIENTIIGNCSSQFYGKASSPAAIETVREQIRQRGGEGADVPQLKAGTFYFFNSDLPMPKPAKLSFASCLSHHRTLEPAEVLARAAATRQRREG